MSNSVIDRFVREKSAWIARTKKKAEEFDARHSPMSISEGGQLMYLGEDYGVARSNDADIAIFGKSIRIPRHYDMPQVTAWMKEKASRIIRERVSHYASVMNLAPKSIRLTNARTRWGSCGGGGSLNFTWKLVMCPPSVIDYVVVHELCHIVHRNHGHLFWESVEKILPRYRDAERWLKDNARLIASCHIDTAKK